MRLTFAVDAGGPRRNSGIDKFCCNSTAALHEGFGRVHTVYSNNSIFPVVLDGEAVGSWITAHFGAVLTLRDSDGLQLDVELI